MKRKFLEDTKFIKNIKEDKTVCMWGWLCFNQLYTSSNYIKWHGFSVSRPSPGGRTISQSVSQSHFKGGGTNTMDLVCHIFCPLVSPSVTL